jgi:serine/threonine protein kinase
MIGTMLAHYEITGHLGTGGMREVYQALDTKLGRSVAIKLLPAALGADPERLSRFRREAQVLGLFESSEHCIYLRRRGIRRDAMNRHGVGRRRDTAGPNPKRAHSH